MKNSIIIKSFQNGISVFLDPDMDFQELLKEIEVKFQQSEKFFKDAKMALSLEGRNLSLAEEKEIIDTITSSSSLQIICLIGKEETTQTKYAKVLEKSEIRTFTKEGQFYRGNLMAGQSLESETSLVIIGDVVPGSTVISMKDVIVFGSIGGKVYAGDDGKNNHFIFSLDMNPEVLQIADYKYKPQKPSLFSKKAKSEPSIAYLKDGKVIMEAASQEIIKTISLL